MTTPPPPLQFPTMLSFIFPPLVTCGCYLLCTGLNPHCSCATHKNIAPLPSARLHAGAAPTSSRLYHFSPKVNIGRGRSDTSHLVAAAVTEPGGEMEQGLLQEALPRAASMLLIVGLVGWSMNRAALALKELYEST